MNKKIDSEEIDFSKFKIKQDRKYPIRIDGKWQFANFFKMDFMSILFGVIIIYLLFAFNHDIGKCEDVISDPCNFCVNANCYDPLVCGVNPKEVSENTGERVTYQNIIKVQ